MYVSGARRRGCRGACPPQSDTHAAPRRHQDPSKEQGVAAEGYRGGGGWEPPPASAVLMHVLFGGVSVAAEGLLIVPGVGRWMGDVCVGWWTCVRSRVGVCCGHRRGCDGRGVVFRYSVVGVVFRGRDVHKFLLVVQFFFTTLDVFDNFGNKILTIELQSLRLMKHNVIFCLIYSIITSIKFPVSVKPLSML